jgi:hypothetical protein
MYRSIRIICLFCLASSILPTFAQEEDTGTTPEVRPKKLQAGLFIGPYFANKKTASFHDGYGIDFDGKKNNFENSYMYNKIIMEYGGGYGQGTDQIAQELGVMHGDWHFDESDMPTYMRYQPAFLIGLQGKYSVDTKNAILLNVNAAKITANGSFTITTIPIFTGSGQAAQTIHEFKIKGTEQRLLFQLGYQHLFGKSDKVNFLMEAGMNITLTKMNNNQIQIKNLIIELTNESYYPGYATFTVVKRVGTGFGAFTGMGVNFNATDAWTIQFVYTPTYEGIKIGAESKLRWQQSLGLRAYYKL